MADYRNNDRKSETPPPGWRSVPVLVPDVPRAELEAALRRQVAGLDARHEAEALRFIDTVTDDSSTK